MLVLDEKYKEFEGSVVPYKTVPPGYTLELELEAREISLVDFAIMTKLPLEVLQDYVSGKIAVTEQMAQKFEEVLGIKASSWLRAQRFHEYCLLVLAEREKKKKQKKAKGFFETMGKVAVL